VSQERFERYASELIREIGSRRGAARARLLVLMPGKSPEETFEHRVSLVANGLLRTLGIDPFDDTSPANTADGAVARGALRDVILRVDAIPDNEVPRDVVAGLNAAPEIVLSWLSSSERRGLG
jgi:hypothetical protein